MRKQRDTIKLTGKCADDFFRSVAGLPPAKGEQREAAQRVCSTAGLARRASDEQPGSDTLAVSGAKAGPAASVLDACCGPKMFWFDREDSRVVFVDKREETHTLPDSSSRGGERTIVVKPDVIADFTALPFPDARFSLVVLDPPHLARNGRESWMAKKYGTLGDNWREEITKGFAECFRVLKPEGTLIFKWNEDEISVQEILNLTPARPLFGSRYGRHFKSHWIVFQKPAALPAASGSEARPANGIAERHGEERKCE